MIENLQTAEHMDRAKQALRHEYLARRKMMSPELAAEASHKICQRLSNFFAELQKLVRFDLYSKTVLSYLAYGREVNLQELHHELWAQGRLLAVPRTKNQEPGVMEAVYLREDSRLETSPLGVLEPAASEEKLCAPEDFAAVMLPGVAFDENGGRLGHGGGYYDRFLAQLPPETLLIGVAYEWQVLPEVPLAEWDVPLDFLVTEKRQRCFTCHCKIKDC